MIEFSRIQIGIMKKIIKEIQAMKAMKSCKIMGLEKVQLKMEL